ncbi:MAG: hypothetical protein M1368_06855 [Thaumarchaeota archaeon]|nr:hypothetical protein [Nitrososphaerota archaeon]
MAVGLAAEQGIIGGLAGLAAGYFVSDLTTYVESGAIPADQLETQVTAVVQKLQTKQGQN